MINNAASLIDVEMRDIGHFFNLEDANERALERRYTQGKVQACLHQSAKTKKVHTQPMLITLLLQVYKLFHLTRVDSKHDRHHEKIYHLPRHHSAHLSTHETPRDASRRAEPSRGFKSHLLRPAPITIFHMCLYGPNLLRPYCIPHTLHKIDMPQHEDVTSSTFCFAPQTAVAPHRQFD